MAPSAALGHVSHVLTCLVHQHAHFEDDVTPPKLVTSAAIPEEVSTRVRRLFPEEVTSELSRLRRWLPSFADGDRVTWGDVADCLLDAIDALPASAARPRAQGELFANLVLSDAVASPPMGNVQKFLSGADVKPRHARLLLDGGSDVTLATLVAAGHITAANRALMNKLAETKDWDERLALVSAAARWEWGGDGTRRVGRAACEAAAAALRFVLDEMIKPASHGAQRRPLALALTTILRSLARGGGDAASVALLPLDDVVDVASSWSRKGNAAAENSALLQSVTALQRRRGGKRAEEELALDAAVRRALLAGLQADKEESKKEALECLVAALEAARVARAEGEVGVVHARVRLGAADADAPDAPDVHELLARAVSVGGTKGPPPQLWGRTERAMAAAARVDPATAVDVAGEMLGAARERAGSKAAKIQGAGSVNARVVALRFVSWALGTREDSDDSECSRADDRAPAAATAETWRRSAALAPAITAALTLPKPSRSSVTRRDADTDRITYVASGSKPDATSGDATEVMLDALRCSPLLLSDSRARGVASSDVDAHVAAVAAASACGTREVETAARRAIRRHAKELSPSSLRRATVHALRSAESAMEGSVDAAEWTCRLRTAAVVVRESSLRPTDDVFFDAAAVGPRAAAAVLLATAHPEPEVHAAAAELLAAAEDLVDVAALSGDALGHGGDASEDRESSLASKLGGGLLRWLSSEASVGPETHSRAVSVLGGWGDDDRVSGWRGKELSAATDAGVRRAAERLAAARVIDYAPPSASSTSGGSGRAAPSVHARAMWRGHVALFVAAARPAGHVSVAANVPPSPVKKMLFADDDDDDDDDSVGDPNAVVAARGLETQVGLGDASRFDSEAVLRWAWSRCAAAAEEGGQESFSPEAASLARLRSDAMIDALSGVAPACLPSIVSVVAASVVAASAVASEAKNASKATWPALARAAAGLTLLRNLASRVVSSASPVSSADATLRLAFSACDAWIAPLAGAARRGYSTEYGDDGVLTDDDGVAVAMRATHAAAALMAFRFHHEPPATSTAADAAMAALTASLPRENDEWRDFANVILEAMRVVAGCTLVGEATADAAVPRLVEASRVAHIDARRRRGECAPSRESRDARRAKALASVVLVKLLLRRSDRAVEASAASLLQAAAATATSSRDVPPAQLLEVVFSALTSPEATSDAGTQTGVVVAASLASLGLSPSIHAAAASYRALRNTGALVEVREETIAAAAAAAAAEEEEEGPSADGSNVSPSRDASPAAEARRGAMFDAAGAFVADATPETLIAAARGLGALAASLSDVRGGSSHSPWIAAAFEAEPEFPGVEKSARGARVVAAAAAILWVVEAIAASARAPMGVELAGALARAAKIASATALATDTRALWTALGAKIGDGANVRVPGGGVAAKAAADAAAEVVDILIAEPSEDETRESFPPSSASSASALGATHLLRSPAGARVARRLAAKATGSEDAATRASATRLIRAALSCPTASVRFTVHLPALAVAAVATRDVAPESRALMVATGASAPDRPDADVPGDVVRRLAGRHPHGKLAFRRALADAALARAESAAREGLTVDTASVVAASLRLFSAAVSPPGSAARACGGAFPVAPLGNFSLRCARVFAFALDDARGVHAAVAAADACSTLATRYAEAGHAAAVSTAAAATTRLCVAVALASISLPSPQCVAAGVRLAVAAGLTSSTRLKTGVAPAIVAALRGSKGAAPADVAAAIFSRILFFSKNSGLDGARPGAKEKQAGGEADASTADPSTAPPTPTLAPPTTPTTTASAHDVLDVACGVLSALPDDGTAGSLDELAILACALRAWPSTTSPPDAAATRDGVAFIRGLGFESLEPVAARFARLEAGGYRQRAAGTDVTAAETAAAASAGARVSSSASARVSSSAKKSVAVTRDDAAKKRSSASPAFGSALPSLRASVRSDSAVGAANRRDFFRDVCDAMGAAGGTSAEAWAQALRSLAAAAAGGGVESAAAAADSTSAARAAAAELLVAWIDARVVAEGEGAWETRALAAAASELVEMDDPALAPAVTALASSRATADPAAVVDAILLGRLVPHADAVAEDDVKTRLPAWTPRGVDSERVRGVSRANEDRLRRWATAWTRDAYASAESLLAKGGGRADESAYVSAGESEDDAGAEPAADPFAGVVEPTPGPTAVPVPAHVLGFESPFAPKRARVAPGAKWRASGLSGMGGVSPATSRKERRRMRATGTSSAEEEPATSPATEPGDGARRRVHASVFRAPEETSTIRRGDPRASRFDAVDDVGGISGGLPPVPTDATETPAATIGGFFRREHIDVDSVEEEKREAREEAREEAHEEEEDDSRFDAARFDAAPSLSARIANTVGNVADVDRLIERMGEMRAFEPDVDADEVTSRAGATRRLRRDESAYAEARSKLRSTLGAKGSLSEAA